MRKLNLTAKKLASSIISAPRKNADSDAATPNMMLDPRYLRQSSTLIQDSLQKGFDVLQLANGDIVTTGTKTIVYQYTWDEEKGKLVKARTDKKGKRANGSSDDENNDDVSEESDETIEESEEA